MTPPKKQSAKSRTRLAVKAKLLRPANPQSASWTFLILPKSQSAKLSTRGATTVEGSLNGVGFEALLEPDGKGSHWLKVTKKLQEAAGATAGDIVKLEFGPTSKPAEPRVPSDLRKALAAAPKAKSTWADITPNARQDWIQWITSAKLAETRARRVKNTCSMLATGKRRACCFDRSGMYSKSLCAPEAAE